MKDKREDESWNLLDRSEAVRRLLEKRGLGQFAKSEALVGEALKILGQQGLDRKERFRRFDAFVERYQRELSFTLPSKKPSVVAPISPKNWPASIGSPAAVREVETFIRAKGMSLTEFATQVGTTDKTLRKFRKTGRIKRSIFDDMAKVMKLTREQLLRG